MLSEPPNWQTPVGRSEFGASRHGKLEGEVSMRSDEPENEGTRIAPITRVPTLTPRGAFLAAFDTLQPFLLRGEADVAVVAIGPDGAAHLVALRAGQRLTIGRHTSCSLRLADASAPLRHLLALVTRDPSGQAVVRLWDLNTEQPFRLEDGREALAVIARGLLFASVGDVVLLFVPIRLPDGRAWPATAAEAWAALPARDIEDARPSAPRRALRLVKPEDESWKSQVRRVATLLPLDQNERPSDVIGELRLRTPTTSTPCLVSAAKLDRGLLLGRYPRCQLSLDHNGVSRVHVLLVRIGGELWALDTASTNGVQRGEDEVDAEVLEDGDVLTLAEGIEVEWRRRSSRA
jgi:hypothetical protein